MEFVGGPMCWNTRTFTATSGEQPCSVHFFSPTFYMSTIPVLSVLGGGAFCNGQPIQVSANDTVSVDI